jgi:hypothetical protein
VIYRCHHRLTQHAAQLIHSKRNGIEAKCQLQLFARVETLHVLQDSDPWKIPSGPTAFHSFSHCAEEDRDKAGGSREHAAGEDTLSTAVQSLRPSRDSNLEATGAESQTLPGSYFETVRQYIPVEVMAMWATVKQVLDVLFDGAINTTIEVNTFAIVWVGNLLHSPVRLCAIIGFWLANSPEKLFQGVLCGQTTAGVRVLQNRPWYFKVEIQMEIK